MRTGIILILLLFFVSCGHDAITNDTDMPPADSDSEADTDMVGYDSELGDEEPTEADEPESDLADKDGGSVVFGDKDMPPDVDVVTPPIEMKWVKQWGVADYDMVYGMTRDEQGHLYIIGTTDGPLDGAAWTEGYCDFKPCADIALIKLTPDGEREWTRLLGSDRDDVPNALVRAADGALYVVGFTNGSLPGNTHAEDHCDRNGKPVPCSEMFIAKWSAAGEFLWARQWGSYYGGAAEGVAIDPAGDIYACGHAVESVDDQPNAGSLTQDVVLTKWTPNGDKVWTRLFGTPGNDHCYDAAADTDGNIYLAGSSYYDWSDMSDLDYYDATLLKVSPEGSLLWVRQWGSEFSDGAISIAMAAGGDLFVLGATLGNLIASSGVEGDVDPMLARFSPDGTLQWQRQWGTDSDDYASWLTIDEEGYLYVVGDTLGLFGGNDLQAGILDSYLTHLTPAGEPLWTKQWGTSDTDQTGGILVTAKGAILVAGSTYGSLPGNENPTPGYADMYLMQWGAIR